MNMALPGDDQVPDANLVYDQTIKIQAPAVAVFPWLLQLGKGRGGLYLKASVERVLPRSWRALRVVEEQHVRDVYPGAHIRDYGLHPEDHLVVVSRDEPTSLVMRGDRFGCRFTWAFVLQEQTVSDRTVTTVSLRFRGKVDAVGWKRWFIVRAGSWADYIYAQPMLQGLKERVEEAR